MPNDQRTSIKDKRMPGVAAVPTGQSSEMDKAVQGEILKPIRDSQKRDDGCLKKKKPRSAGFPTNPCCSGPE